MGSSAASSSLCQLLFLVLLLFFLLALGARLLVLLLRLRCPKLRLSVVQVGARLKHRGLRRGAGRDAVQNDHPERRQRAAVERGGEDGAAGVGDLVIYR